MMQWNIKVVTHIAMCFLRNTAHAPTDAHTNERQERERDGLTHATVAVSRVFVSRETHRKLLLLEMLGSVMLAARNLKLL